MGLVNGRPMVAHWLLVGGGHFWGVGYIPVVLLPCVRRSGMGWGHVNVPCTCSATCCYAAQMSGSVASLYTLSKWSAVLEDLLLYLKCWQWRYVNLHAHLQQKTISPYFTAEAPALKRKKEKTCQHAPMRWTQIPHETRILPNSRARIWHNSACRNVCFAMAKIRFVTKTLFLRARFPVRWVECAWYFCRFAKNKRH